MYHLNIHCGRKSAFLLETVDAGHFTERGLRVEAERIQDEVGSVIDTDQSADIGRCNYIDGTSRI